MRTTLFLIAAALTLFPHRAGDPLRVGDLGDRREPHADGPADDFENGRNGVNVSQRLNDGLGQASTIGLS